VNVVALASSKINELFNQMRGVEKIKTLCINDEKLC